MTILLAFAFVLWTKANIQEIPSDAIDIIDARGNLVILINNTEMTFCHHSIVLDPSGSPPFLGVVRDHTRRCSQEAFTLLLTTYGLSLVLCTKRGSTREQ